MFLHLINFVRTLVAVCLNLFYINDTSNFLCNRFENTISSALRVFLSNWILINEMSLGKTVEISWVTVISKLFTVVNKWTSFLKTRYMEAYSLGILLCVSVCKIRIFRLTSVILAITVTLLFELNPNVGFNQALETLVYR